MNAELKAKWIAALRSGEYTQGKGTLRTIDDKFCCLGVLGNICASDKWQFHKAEGKDDIEYWSFEKDDSLLPDGFADKLGLEYKTQETLSELNDGNVTRNIEPHSFEQIAEYIEKKL